MHRESSLDRTLSKPAARGAPNIRAFDILFLDEFFEMGGGNVLNLLAKSMSRFFFEELKPAPAWLTSMRRGIEWVVRCSCFGAPLDYW